MTNSLGEMGARFSGERSSCWADENSSKAWGINGRKGNAGGATIIYNASSMLGFVSLSNDATLKIRNAGATNNGHFWFSL